MNGDHTWQIPPGETRIQVNDFVNACFNPRIGGDVTADYTVSIDGVGEEIGASGLYGESS